MILSRSEGKMGLSLIQNMAQRIASLPEYQKCYFLNFICNHVASMLLLQHDYICKTYA